MKSSHITNRNTVWSHWNISKPTKPDELFRVLIVDDVSTNRSLLKRLIERTLNTNMHLYPTSKYHGKHAVVEDSEDGHFAVGEVLGITSQLAIEYNIAGRFPAGMTFLPQRLAHFDVIVMDYQMPIMNGPDATRMMRAGGFTGAIYGCTGETTAAEHELFKAAGASRVFTKPCQVREMIEAMMGEV